MKKAIGIVAGVVAVCALVFCLAGCGGGVPVKTSDLSGNWKQTNAESDAHMEAVIAGDTITVNWVTADSTALYWAGTYVAPSEATDSYTWDSAEDGDKNSKSLIAPLNETKTFTYSNGVLSFISATTGTTITVEMKRS